MADNQVKVVHDDDLISLLKSLRVYQNVIDHEKKCIYCNSKITLENIDAIIPINNGIEFSCNKSECHLKLIEGSDKINVT